MSIKSAIKGCVPKSVMDIYYSMVAKKIYNFEKKLNEKDYEKYLEDKYFKTFGKKMNFDNPVTYTEKQQWLKLYGQSELKTLLTDKYRVRSWIKERLGNDEILIPTIAIDGKDHWNNADEIDFNKLPNQFVIQANHGSGMIVIVKDKSSLTNEKIRKIKKQLNKWLNINNAYRNGLELIYRDVEPCLIIEEFIQIDGDLPDYKFMCFDGEAKYVWCDQGRFIQHRRSLFDTDWQEQAFCIGDYLPIQNKVKPENLSEMVEIAKKLSKGFEYARVDLYNVNGKIYFGEMTFSSCGGYEETTNEEINISIGNCIKIDRSLRDNNMKYRRK